MLRPVKTLAVFCRDTIRLTVDSIRQPQGSTTKVETTPNGVNGGIVRKSVHTGRFLRCERVGGLQFRLHMHGGRTFEVHDRRHETNRWYPVNGTPVNLVIGSSLRGEEGDLLFDLSVAERAFFKEA